MSIFRTAKQVAFTDLLIAVEDSVDNYSDLAELHTGSTIAAAFHTFIRERQPLVAKLENEMRLLDDLPSRPDADREDFGKLAHRIRAAFSRDEIPKALQEMLAKEEHTLELARNCAKEALNQSEQNIIAEMVKQVEQTIHRLRLMTAQIKL